MSKLKIIYLVNIMLFIQFILVGGSGLIMYFFHHAGGPLMRLIHDKIGVLMLVFFAAHLILNWKWIMNSTKKFLTKNADSGRN
jgi:hypothetical protein